MREGQADDLQLDQAENGAVHEFLRMIERQGWFPPPNVLLERMSRMADGTIIVPVTLAGAHPSLSLAMLMNHKTDQLYRQTSCRVRLAQYPSDDPQGGGYLWGGTDWVALC